MKKNKLTKVNPYGLTLSVLKLIDKGLYAKQIADELNRSKVAIRKHLMKLDSWGYITSVTRSNIIIYDITAKGKRALHENKLTPLSYSTTSIEKGMHDVYIKLPIIHAPEYNKTFWDKVNYQFKNSKQYHKHFEAIQASIRQTTKHICIQLKPRNLENYDQVYGIISGAIGYTLGILTPMGYELDYLNPVVKGIHITYGDEKSQEMMNKKLRIKMELGRDRTKIFPNDPKQTALVWLDKTPSDNWETNDYEHAKLRALEPEMVKSTNEKLDQLIDIMTVYGEHLNAHIPVLNGMDKLLRKLDRHFSKKNQKRIGEYI